MMRTKQSLVTALMAVVMGLGASIVLAQNNDRPGSPGRPGGPGGDRGGRPDFRDPAQRESYMMDRTKERLEITDEGEWKAIQPLVKKVMDAQQTIMSDRIRGFMGRSRGGDDRGDQGRRGFGSFGNPSPEADALQRAIDGKASKEELKAAIGRFQETRKTKQAELEKAQAELRKVLTLRQEAIATASGLL